MNFTIVVFGWRIKSLLKLMLLPNGMKFHVLKLVKVLCCMINANNISSNEAGYFHCGHLLWKNCGLTDLDVV